MCGAGELVDDDLIVLGDEQFDGQRASQFEALGQANRQFMRFASHMFGHLGGGDGHMQDVVAVLVTHNREGDEVLAVAGDQNRSLECEVDEAFQDARREATTTVGAGADLLQVGVGTQHELTVAVVAADTVFSTAG